MDKNFAIIDLETTGGSASREKIIEIAIVIFDGEKIIDSFESLIYPERSIPQYITRITGINNQMVSESPKFYEVAKKVIEITENCIFVAHNVRFDYSFIHEEFKRLGYNYYRKQLCTIKLFRRFFPGLKSYALGNLIKEFNIKVKSRHRAMDDVMATLDIFKIGLKIPSSSKTLSNIFGISIKETTLPSGIDYEKIEKLPEEVGVYYFLDMFKSIVYIGKSINIKKRVKQHFQNINSKSNKFYNTVRDITFELTGSEMIALLKEAEEIKKYNPPINKALKKSEFPYSIFYRKNNEGYITFDISKVDKPNDTLLSEFRTRIAAKSYLEHFIETHYLCNVVSGLQKSNGACFEFGLEKCFGACINLENAESYNSRILHLLAENEVMFPNDTFIIVEKGRYEQESSIVLIVDNKYTGYFYIDNNRTNMKFSEVNKLIQKVDFDPDFNKIIKRFISNENLVIKTF